jgi:hypothetical protein
MDNFNYKKYLAEGKLLKEEITPSRDEIFDDFEEMAKDLSYKIGAEVDTITFGDQLRFVTRDLPYFGWWGEAMHDISIKNINPSEEKAKQAYNSAKEFIDTFTEKYLDYKSFIDKGEKSFKQEVERRRKERRGDAWKPIEDGTWDMDDNPYYSNFFSKP